MPGAFPRGGSLSSTRWTRRMRSYVEMRHPERRSSVRGRDCPGRSGRCARSSTRFPDSFFRLWGWGCGGLLGSISRGGDFSSMPLRTPVRRDPSFAIDILARPPAPADIGQGGSYPSGDKSSLSIRNIREPKGCRELQMALRDTGVFSHPGFSQTRIPARVTSRSSKRAEAACKTR